MLKKRPTNWASIKIVKSSPNYYGRIMKYWNNGILEHPAEMKAMQQKINCFHTSLLHYSKVSLLSLAIIFFTLFLSIRLSAQSITQAEKNEALREMQFGRYGEAIDLLNKYISAHPQQADGYNLRGLCYEKRKQYEYAVYDYRSARKLEPNNKEINANLARATASWYSLIYNDIEGYKREIAINPKDPENYLAIGKDYKNLGQWSVAEEWYDKYLTMAHASPDEIIRYSEILAKTNHIAKGWPVLKKYTEEYPNDQRLWSRFGYFSLWLGKTQIAIQAFENSLAIKPYFKEAMDGLDEARGKGYIFTVNDTSVKHFNYGMPPVRPAFVYPIDRYYSILKRHPQDNETRIKLIDSLLVAKRFEEVNQQLQILQNDKYDSTEVAALSGITDSLSQIYYAKQVSYYKTKFAADSSDRNTALQLAQYYSKLQDYDSTMMVYDAYLRRHPGDKEILFKYAKAEANNREFFKASARMQKLLNSDPNNLEYQLFSAQLDVWIGQNLDTAKIYLDNVLSKEPNNIPAMVAMSSLSMRQNDFTLAENYMDKIKALDPSSTDLSALQSSLTMNKFRYKQEQNYAILREAENLYAEHKCDEAAAKYKIFLANSAPNAILEREYGDILACAGKYQQAIDTYNNVLSQGYDFNADYSRATTYFAMGDSVKALEEFKRLAKEHPDNFNVNLYLGDSYMRMKEYGKAEDVYNNMKDNLKLDSSQVATVDQRYKWMPVTGFNGFLSTFPTYALLTPTASYYNDNQGVINSIEGLRLDLGITSFLSVGAEGFRTQLSSNATRIYSNTYRWDITLRLLENLILGANFGSANYSNSYRQPVAEIYARSEVADQYSVYGSYSQLDASQVIYSPYLIGYRLNAHLFRAGGYYQTKSGLRTTLDFSLMNFSDGNQGYSLGFRLGKYFYPHFMLGYAYFGSGFQNTSPLYFSPNGYSTHNLFADWDIIRDSSATVTIGGLIGFVANSSYIIRQGYITATYRLFDRLTLQGSLVDGSSVFNYAGYSSYMVRFAAYWSL